MSRNLTSTKNVRLISFLHMFDVLCTRAMMAAVFSVYVVGHNDHELHIFPQCQCCLANMRTQRVVAMWWCGSGLRLLTAINIVVLTVPQI